MENVSDRIEKKIVLRAPRSRVWAAISDAQQFGVWFGARFDEPFVVGKPVKGCIAPTQVDDEVAKMQKPHEGKPFHATIERIDAEHTFAFRWHPFAIDPAVDYSQEPTTLVTFSLADVEGGTEVTIVESGFDKVPLARRAQAFKANSGGWQHQAQLLEKYLVRVS